MALRRVRTTHLRFWILDFGLRASSVSRFIGPAVAAVLMTVIFWGAQPAVAKTQSDPSFLHGVGQVIGGILFELPKTVLDATLTGPPVAGTAVGLLAGTARALQTTVAGLLEMAAGFNPWGITRTRR